MFANMTGAANAAMFGRDRKSIDESNANDIGVKPCPASTKPASNSRLDASNSLTIWTS